MLYKLLLKSNTSTFEQYVICLQGKGYYGDLLQNQGITVHALDIKGPFSLLRGVFRYFKSVRAIQPTLIHCWMYHALWWSVLLRKITPNARLVFNIRTSLDGLKYESFFLRQMIYWAKFLTKYAQKIIYNSTHAAQQHKNKGWHGLSLIIPNGFDTDKFKPSKDIYAQIRTYYHLSPDTKIVGMVGRNHPIKNQKGFLEIAKDILNKTKEDVCFMLVGEGCMQYAQPPYIFGINKSPAETIIPAFDVLVLPSWGESFPNVVGEAMSCGVPCVTTQVGDCKKIVNTFGYVHPAGDYTKMAKSVMKLLQESQKQLDKNKKASRAYVKKNYDLSIINKQYETLYKSLVK